MRHLFTAGLTGLLALLTAAGAAAQGEAEGTLYTRTEDGLIRAAVVVELAPGWHLYHGPTREDMGPPGAIGSPTTVELTGEGVTWSPVRYPEPFELDQSEVPGGTFIYAYEDEAIFYAIGSLAEGATGDDVSVQVKGLVCEVACIPYRETLEPDGRGPDSIFEEFPQDLAAPAAVEPAPKADDKRGGEADATLYTRVEDGRVRAALEIEITPGWHLYHEELGNPKAIGAPTKIELEGAGVEWTRLVWPEPHELDQSDIVEGAWIWSHEDVIVVYAEGELAEGASGDGLWGTIQGQTCERACVPYNETFVSKGRGPDALFADFPEAEEPESGGTDGGAEEDDEGEDVGDSGLLAFLLLAVGGGLFALVMPCTYPMIPITISFFTKQADARGGNVLPLSLAYGAGIVLIFVLIGVLLGAPIARFAANPWVNIVIGVAFVYFAFVLFGKIDLQPPRFLMNAAGQASMRGGFIGVFLMGATLVVTSFTCTAPFVGSLLSYGAQGGGVARVALGMGVFGLTMAIPFIFLSLVPGKLKTMPKSGEWMNTLKVFLGFVELAASLKFFSNSDIVWGLGFLSRELFLLLWGVIFVAAALYLFGAFSSKAQRTGFGVKRLAGGALTVALAAYCFWGMSGVKLDRVMTAIAPNYSGGVLGWNWYETGGSWQIVKDEYDEALELAEAQDKLLLVNFTGFS
jgi:thiol:disulfide interchange protein DsbD